MAKHLFRPNFTLNGKLTKRSESFLKTDRALAKYVNVHTINLDYKQAAGKVSMHGRDCITEWGDDLAIIPGLMEIPAFIEIMQRLGYKKRIVPTGIYSEGGLYVFGKEFMLISDVVESEPALFKEAAKCLPVHFVTGISCGGHIDCDYQIIDSLRLIYMSHNVAVSESGRSSWKDKKPKSKIEEIAKLYGYEIREYPSYDADVPKEQPISEILKRLNGINSILMNETLLTSSIHPNEKKYLRRSGLEAIVIPLGDVAPGAGLRCMYGEFNT
jgi:hypothetical protein